jgi:hypothetical protein
MPKQVRPSAPQVSVTFKLSEEAHRQMLMECGRCSCNVSAFIRSAVMKEVIHRRTERKQAAQHAALTGQLSIEEVLNA